METDNGAGSVINSRQFNLLPRELPELVRRLLLSAQQQQPFIEAYNRNNKYQRYSAVGKRSEGDSSLSQSSVNDEHVSSLEKRSTDMSPTDLEGKMNDSFNKQQRVSKVTEKMFR